MNANLKQNMSILMGGTGAQKPQELSAEAKQKLSKAYFDLFFGLAGTNWGRGEKTLGAAWYEALSQIKSMIAAKDKSNPAAMYMNQIFAAHNAKWSQIVMTNPNREKKLELTSEDRAKWSQECAKQIGGAMGVINTELARKPQKAAAAKSVTTKNPADIQKKILMFMAAQQKMKAA